MVKHIILWTLKSEYTESEKQEIKAGIKEGLEGLSSSNVGLMLDSTFESEQALKAYAVHPEHVAVADGKVRPYIAERRCLDFEV